MAEPNTTTGIVFCLAWRQSGTAYFNRCRPLPQTIESIRLARISFTMFDGWLSRSLKTLSMTDSSVDVVSSPQNAAQSLATKPPPMTSLPRFTVPATNGTCSREDSSSKSSTDVEGCTYRLTASVMVSASSDEQCMYAYDCCLQPKKADLDNSPATMLSSSPCRPGL